MSGLEELLENAKNGDRQAVDAIVAQFSDVIDRECKKFGYWTEPDWSHSDMVQDVFLRVWSRLDQFHGSNSIDFRTALVVWLKRTTRSVLINLHRDRSAKKRKPDQPPKPFNEETQVFVSGNGKANSPSSIFTRKENANQLNTVLFSQLDSESVQILMMKIVDGFSFKQIAERLDLTYDKVRYRYDSSLSALEISMRRYDS